MGDAVCPILSDNAGQVGTGPTVPSCTARKEGLGHMKALQGIGTSRPWNRYVVLRVVLAMGALVSLVLASGAGSHS